jgi:tRNA A37 threonylcarbamoyladenosine biosynthesis protein TsaE
VNPADSLMLRVFRAGCKLPGAGTILMRSSDRGAGKRRLAIGPILAILKGDERVDSPTFDFFPS